MVVFVGGVLFVLLGAGLWIGIALPFTGILSLVVFTDFPPGGIVAWAGFNWNNSFILTAIPLFIFMSEVLLRSKVSEQLFRGISPWVSYLPGGLLHTNVLACAVFAAVSGSSSATTATIGTVAIPEEKRRNYNKRLMLGTLCGSGSLGLLIPPSIVMILYAVIVGESVGMLFIGGILPGIMIATLFVIYIGCVSLLRPQVGLVIEKLPLKPRLKGLLGVMPTGILIFMVLGGIYLGWATPTEAAAVGAGGAVIISLMGRTLNYQRLKEAMFGAVKTSSMIMFIVMGAAIYAMSIAYLGLGARAAEFIGSLTVSRYLILGCAAILYLGLGCLMDGASMMLLTLPVLYPIMMGLGFDSVWFGVALVILIEIAQITPPVGFNLFVLHGISGEPIGEIVLASIPFFLLLLLGFVIVTIFPSIILFLPHLMIA